MEFCPKCGIRLVLTRKPLNNVDHTFLTCSKCNYLREVTNGQSVFLKVIDHSTSERIAVINGDCASIRTMPTMKVQCPKCDNREAFWWIVQTRGADESPTQFFRCTKCTHTWREMA